MLPAILLLWIAAVSRPLTAADNPGNETVEEFLLRYDREMASYSYRSAIAAWDYNTNITKENEQRANELESESTIFAQGQAAIAASFNLREITNSSQRRQIEKIADVGIKLNGAETKQLAGIISSMQSTYSTARVCNFKSPNCDLQIAKIDNKNCDQSEAWLLDPCLEDLLARSRDYKLLAYIWEAWRNASGRPIKQRFWDYVQLSNKGALEGGFPDAGAVWRNDYETPTFEQQLQRLWYELLPLYEQLHAYIRRKLMEQYKDSYPDTSAIPAHLLGNMWSQSWANTLPFSIPYPGEATVDVTDELQAQNYTAERMFRTAEAFFVSIGLPPMTPEFWQRSMISRPADRDVVCHASAWDFSNGRDFGIKMCTKINMEDLITIHHEMGHIQYDLAYANQPLVFHGAANPGFHEAIGDTIAFSVTTPTHLQKIGLLPYYSPNERQDINFLFKMALDKIAFIPFGYLVDQYRWKVFDGTIPESGLNAAWWDMRFQYQGIRPPLSRSEADFDAGAKFHVASSSQYIGYFVSHMVQFQFHKALCEAAGWTGPLHRCDIANNTAAGGKLQRMLQMGYSRPWPEALNAIAGTTEMSAAALLEYFKPLADYLQKENSAASSCYGWGQKWPSYLKLQQPRCRESWKSSQSAMKEHLANAEEAKSVGLSIFESAVLAMLSLVIVLSVAALLCTARFGKKWRGARISDDAQLISTFHK